MESQNLQNSEATTTKPSRLLKAYRLGKNIVAFSFLFAVAYTIVYQFIDGPHWVSISESEKMLDTITSRVWNIGCIIMFFCMGWKMDSIMEGRK
jgi:hypothetical protein